MPIYIEEGVFCSNTEYQNRTSERIRAMGSIAVGSILMAMLSLVGKNVEAAKKPIRVVEQIQRRRSLFVVTFDICDDDMVPEVRTTERFDREGYMKPSAEVVIYETGKTEITYEIVEAYLVPPREEFDEIDLFLARSQPMQV